MTWNEWDDVNTGDIVRKSRLDQIQENLQYLAAIDIGTSSNSGTGVGRCVSHYVTIYATDNNTHCKTDCGSQTTNLGCTAPHCDKDCHTVNAGIGKCNTGLLNNTRYNNCSSNYSTNTTL